VADQLNSVDDDSKLAEELKVEARLNVQNLTMSSRCVSTSQEKSGNGLWLSSGA
jgi:hypothetical protein